MTRNKTIKKILGLIKLINDKIDKLDKQVTKRKRKISARDILYLCILKNGNNSSYDEEISKMKYNDSFDASKSAVIQKRYNIDNNLFDEIFNVLKKYIYDTCKIENAFAVDGTYIFINKNQLTDEFKDKHKNYNKVLVSSVFNVNSKTPNNYNIYGNCNERKALIDQLKSVPPKSTLILDRGYYSRRKLKQVFVIRIRKLCLHSDRDLLDEIIGLDHNVIFRLSCNTFKGQLTDRNDQIVTVKTKNGERKLRVIRYTIPKTMKRKTITQKYLIGTTLHDKKYTINFFKKMYWKRWAVETDFRFLKKQMSLDNLKSKNINIIKQDIFTLGIISVVNGLIKSLRKTSKNINNKNSLNLTVNEIFHILLYEKNSEQAVNNIIKILGIILSTVYENPPGRHFHRLRKKPNSEWINPKYKR